MIGRVGRLALVTAALLGTGAPPAAAQSKPDLVREAARAYQELRLDLAAGLLRRALGERGDTLPAVEHARALTYLAAVERLRGRRDSSLSAFRQLIAHDPTYRPDPLVFPPEVTALFEQVRRTTKLVSVSLPTDTTLTLGDAQLSVRLHASSPHVVRVTVNAEDGAPLRSLYAGPVGDGLDVTWDARDAAGRAVPAGRLWLTVASLGPDERPRRLTRVPLDVMRSALDTLPHPPPPDAATRLPERVARGSALRALLGGLVLGSAAIALPPLVVRDDPPSDARFLVGAVLGMSGVIGFVTQRPGRLIPHHVAANEARRARWRAATAEVARENATRLARTRLRVRAGPPEMIEVTGP